MLLYHIKKKKKYVIPRGKSLVNSNNDNICKYVYSTYHVPALYIYAVCRVFRKAYEVDTVTVSMLQVRKLRVRMSNSRVEVPTPNTSKCDCIRR